MPSSYVEKIKESWSTDIDFLCRAYFSFFVSLTLIAPLEHASSETWEERIANALQTSSAFQAFDHFSCVDIYNVCPTNDGWTILALLGGPCEGISVWCLAPGANLPPSCRRYFDLAIDLLDASEELDSLNRNSATYSLIDYPARPEDIIPRETEIRVPLGRPFKVRYQADKMSGGEGCRTGVQERVEATYDISDPVNIGGIFNPPDPRHLGYVLFKDAIVVPLGDNVDLTEVEFMPVHLGTTTITVSPYDSQIPVWILKVKVESPLFLGEQSSHPRDDQELQDYISIVAHLSGFPPQLLKAWIQKETFAGTDHFNSFTYRYEPGYQKSEVNNHDTEFKRSMAGYAIKATANGWIQHGSSILEPASDPVLDYRNRYCIENCDQPVQNRRYITRSDLGSRDITAADIMTGNKSLNLGGKGEWKVALGEGTYNFVAQTVISSSYGLVNMMFPTFRVALRRLKLSHGAEAMPSPTLLFDTYSNLIEGTSIGIPCGSLLLSTAHLVYQFWAEEPGTWSVDTDRNAKRYFDSFNALLKHHNPLEQRYTADIKKYRLSYLPRPRGCVINDSEMCS